MPIEEMARPFKAKAREALLSNDLERAVAYLTSGIRVAPESLDLYLERAQIFQYGLNNCGRALKDYRYIMTILASNPNPDLANKCRKGMRDMMSPE